MGAISTVCMPESVPPERVKIIEGLGSTVELVSNERLLPRVNEYVSQGRTLIHPFDDKYLIAGHGNFLSFQINQINQGVAPIIPNNL